MYTIYSDGYLLYSPIDNMGKHYQLSKAKLTYELNKAGSLELGIPSNNYCLNNIQKLKSIIRVLDDGEEIWRGRLLDDEKDFYNNRTAFCEGELAFLNDAVVPPYDYSSNGITVDEYIKRVMSWYYNYCSSYRRIIPGTISLANPSAKMLAKLEDYSDVMTELTDKVVNQLGGYFKIRHQNNQAYLDYYSDLTDNISDQSIIFGRNLLDLTEYVDASEVYTYIIPLGKKNDNGKRVDITSVNGGVNYLKSTQGEELFGRITKAVAWDDTTDPSTLKLNGQNLLNSVIEMATTIEINALDLKLLGVDVSRLQVGQFVPVSSPPHGIESNFLCSKIELDLLEPDQSKYTFGLTFSALTDEQVASKKQSSDAYKTAQDTANAYNSIRTEIYENYVSTAQFNNFKAEVEKNFSDIGDFNPENYVTKTAADNTYAAKTTVDQLVNKVNNIDQRVSALEQGGSET